MNHSIIPPSSAGIWGKTNGCTGWVLMSQQYPETKKSIDAMEGDASHEIGAALIENATRGIISVSPATFIGKKASNGVIFTDEMFDAANEYANDVSTIMRERGVFGGPILGIENRIEAKQVHDLSYGRCDFWLYDKNNRELFIWDYKFGYELVEVFENWQLINYVAGLIERLEINGLIDQYITVRFRVAQPRAFHRDGSIRQWTITASDLRGYFNILHNNAHKALSNESEIHTGSHCRHCTARHACSAALKAGLQLYEVTAKPIPINLSPEALGVQLSIVRRAKEQIGYLESGLEEQVKNLIKSGTNILGWNVIQGYSHEKWNRPIPEIITMGNMFGHNLSKPDEAITPVQARKLGIDDAVIKAYSSKYPTKIKIEPDTGSKAKQYFK